MDEREREINVGMAELKIAAAPMVLTSLGLGSCVGVTIYDQINKVGGMAHIMLPDINIIRNKLNRAKCVNTAIPDLLQNILEAGGDKRYLKAKLTGGAHMFGFASNNSVFNIGQRNIEKSKEVLRELGVRLVAEDTGGDYGRSLFFDLVTGKLRIRTVAHGEKEI